MPWPISPAPATKTRSIVIGQVSVHGAASSTGVAVSARAVAPRVGSGRAAGVVRPAGRLPPLMSVIVAVGGCRSPLGAPELGWSSRGSGPDRRRSGPSWASSEGSADVSWPSSPPGCRCHDGRRRDGPVAIRRVMSTVGGRGRVVSRVRGCSGSALASTRITESGSPGAGSVPEAGCGRAELVGGRSKLHRLEDDRSTRLQRAAVPAECGTSLRGHEASHHRTSTEDRRHAEHEGERPGANPRCDGPVALRCARCQATVRASRPRHAAARVGTAARSDRVGDGIADRADRRHDAVREIASRLAVWVVRRGITSAGPWRRARLAKLDTPRDRRDFTVPIGLSGDARRCPRASGRRRSGAGRRPAAATGRAAIASMTSARYSTTEGRALRDRRPRRAARHAGPQARHRAGDRPDDGPPAGRSRREAAIRRSHAPNGPSPRYVASAWYARANASWRRPRPRTGSPRTRRQTPITVRDSRSTSTRNASRSRRARHRRPGGRLSSVRALRVSSNLRGGWSASA